MKVYSALLTIVLFIFLAPYCTKKDQIVAPDSSNTNTLTSIKTSTAPSIDGTVDAVWENAQKLSFNPTVPDPGNGLFGGYVGEKYPATIRSMYDDQNIYFLVEWNDATNNSNVTPWYFDPVAKLWKQELNAKQFDANGNLVRTGFGEDKLAMLWNINNSTPKFLTQTCYASCHVFTPYMDYSTTPAVYKSNAASGNHYTNGPDEKIDMWWGRLGYMAKDASVRFFDDNYQDWAGGPAISNLTGGNANGRHVDEIYPDGSVSATWPSRPNYTVSPAQGEINNRVSLKLDGTGTSVNVPQWIISGAATANFILSADTLTGGKAVKITGVSSTGVLSYSGGSIDPNSSSDYNRTGDAVNGNVGPKSIPAFIASPLVGGRADIAGAAVYTGTGWVAEYKRKLKTADVLKQDVDFSGLSDQQFGVAIWNGSNYQHGINPNLVLKFKK